MPAEILEQQKIVVRGYSELVHYHFHGNLQLVYHPRLEAFELRMPVSDCDPFIKYLATEPYCSQ